jgi:NDP-sugar pyrophosphorylase family protein
MHISGNVQVYDNATISGNNIVSGNVQVYGNAYISGNALVAGGDCIVWFSNVGRDNGTLTVFKSKDNITVTRGCFIGSMDEFLSKSEKEHDDRTHVEYRMLIEVAYSRLTRNLLAPL